MGKRRTEMSHAQRGGPDDDDDDDVVEEECVEKVTICTHFALENVQNFFDFSYMCKIKSQ